MIQIRTRALGLSAGLAALLLPGAAQASTVSVSPTTGILTYAAAQGEVNDIAIAQNNTIVKVQDSGATITAGAGCQSTDAHNVLCSPQGVVRIAVGASDGDDRVTAKTLLPATLGGSAGNDTLTGGSADEKFDGGSGDDAIDPGLGADQIKGGDDVDFVTYATRTARVEVSVGDGQANDGEDGENDNLDASVENLSTGSGDDQFSGPAAVANRFDGGTGSDSVTYATRTAGVGVSLDGLANDGEPNEHDNAVAIENINATGHTDLLVGSDAPNQINAGAGLDLVFGLGGDDRLIGGNGDDGLIAGAGSDLLEGGFDDDSLAGEGGDDTLDGGFGEDVMEGGADTDTASYAARVQTVAVTIDGAANDGQIGEGDTVRTDVENVVGGNGDDVLSAPPEDVNGNNLPAHNELSGGLGDDQITGSGNDTLLGGPDDDVLSEGNILRGEGGNDRLDGRNFDDVLDGGPGEDRLDPGRGADDVSGGPGRDMVQFVRIGAVTVSLDDVANDVGGSGGFDNIRSDVEVVLGTPGDDVLHGSDGPDELQGSFGEDTLVGFGGPDVLNGGADHDTIDAFDGEPDQIFCGPSLEDDVFKDKVIDIETGDCG